MSERSFLFGEDSGLVGTVCLPPPDRLSSANVAVVLFNAGVVHRIGPHRINVRLARRLVAKGIPSIRFDLAGQGDSARSSGSCPFEQQAVIDIRAAMDVLGAASHIQRFVLFGFCSGGVHSYSTAKVDKRVVGLLMYDTYIFPTLKSRINRYLNKFRVRDFGVSVAEWFNWRLLARISWFRSIFQSGSVDVNEPQNSVLVQPVKGEFAETLANMNRGGMKIGMIYSGGFERYNYRNQFADAFKAYEIVGAVTSEHLSEMDHTATLMDEQDVFMQVIEQWCVDLNRFLD